MNILYSDIKYKFEKLEYLREIQRLKSAITCYQESENFAGKDVSLYDSLHPNQCTYRNVQGGNGRIISHRGFLLFHLFTIIAFNRTAPPTFTPFSFGEFTYLLKQLTKMFAALNSKFNFKVNNKLHVHLG